MAGSENGQLQQANGGIVAAATRLPAFGTGAAAQRCRRQGGNRSEQQQQQQPGRHPNQHIPAGGLAVKFFSQGWLIAKQPTLGC
jgi:hypothetical protein